MAYVGNKCKELKRNYPHESGTGASQKHEGRVVALVPVEGSNVSRRNKAGMR